MNQPQKSKPNDDGNLNSSDNLNSSPQPLPAQASAARIATRVGLQSAVFLALLGVVFVGGFSLQDIKAGMRQPATAAAVAA